ncbi:MAG: preprotein translocase subunit SecE [Candidatus Gastranaerophilales bacterium]|nr:preprotein translocase subunit SecE [Candidatus Gastranaerophilales bacterium]
MAESADNKSNFKEDLKVYLKGVKSEWGKITWPSKQQVVTETIYVIIVTTVFTVMILAMDLLFQWILSFLPKM